MQLLTLYFPVIFSIQLVIVFFGTIRITRRKYKFKTSQAIIRAFLVTIGVAIVSYLAYVATVLGVIYYVEENKFDKVEWNTKITERWKMRKDIQESKILIGLDSSAVRKTLGKPSFIKKSDNTWIYDLKSHPEGFSLLFSNLQVKFNQNKVVKVEYLDTAD